MLPANFPRADIGQRLDYRRARVADLDITVRSLLDTVKQTERKAFSAVARLPQR
jgi:hypothetical protein